jgi:hypothetical protein
LEFNGFIGDSVEFIGINSKYWVTAGYTGIFLRYDLSKTGITSTSQAAIIHLSGVNAESSEHGFFTQGNGTWICYIFEWEVLR